MLIDKWTAATHIREAVEDLSAADINRMSMADYAEIRRRAGLPEIDPFATAYAAYEPGSPAPVQQPQNGPQTAPDAPQGIDPDSDEYFLTWRQNRVSGGEGKGIFDSVGSRSDAYAAGVRRHAGRGALSSANVVEPPRVEGRYVRHDDMRDTRPAAERFSNQANAFGISG
jgi:hypothetical protein